MRSTGTSSEQESGAGSASPTKSPTVGSRDVPPKPAHAASERFEEGAWVFCLARVFDRAGVKSLFRGEPFMSVEHGNDLRSVTGWEMRDCYQADQYVPRTLSDYALRRVEALEATIDRLEAAARALLAVAYPSPEANALRLELDPPSVDDDV